MIDKIYLEDILFLDIETVPESDDFSKLDNQNYYGKKRRAIKEKKTILQRHSMKEQEYGLSGKIMYFCWYFNINNDLKKFRVTSFYGKEKQILLDFKNLLQSHFNQHKHKLCGHNSKEFDIPFIARRMIINNIQLPDKLNLFGKKPWEIPHLDTMDLWKFGDYKHFTSLKLLTHVLGIPTPKDDISGDKVRHVYYEENDLDRIVTYCEKDTIAVAQLLLKLQNKPLLETDEILHL